jgi:hypothetical protein
MELQITCDYAIREGVSEWLLKYCRRNKIKVEIKTAALLRFRDISLYYELVFKSQNQMDYFVRIGNENFPYFEFL